MFKINHKSVSSMIPATEEDRLKSQIYYRVGLVRIGDYLDYIRECRKKLEEEKYLSKPVAMAVSLEDELLSLAYSFIKTPENRQRKIDVRALKSIKKHMKCSGNDPIVVHYFRIYKDIKRTLPGFLSGYYCIEDCLEDGREAAEIILADRVGKTLQDQLVKLVDDYQRAPEDKKRKIDGRALQTIRRCARCKNSDFLTRSYYRVYYHMTGRGRKGNEEIQDEAQVQD